jgi:hypothetical protein
MISTHSLMLKQCRTVKLCRICLIRVSTKITVLELLMKKFQQMIFDNLKHPLTLKFSLLEKNVKKSF